MLLPVAFLILQRSLAQTSAVNPLAVLTRYTGAWTMTSPQSLAGAGKDDHVVNHCLLAEAYYACEQVVNGKPMALIVFTPAGAPGTFHTQTVLPSGYAAGRGDLTVAGEHWTFLGRAVSDDGKTATWFRTENTFTGPDHIHFEPFQSNDGTTWKQTNAGDEQRQTRP